MEIALLANVSGATSAKIWCVAKRRRMRAWREKVSQFSNIQYYSIKTPGRRPRCERCVQIGFFGTTEGHLVHRKTPNNSARRALPFYRRFSFAQISQTHTAWGWLYRASIAHYDLSSTASFDKQFRALLPQMVLYFGYIELPSTLVVVVRGWNTHRVCVRSHRSQRKYLLRGELRLHYRLGRPSHE